MFLFVAAIFVTAYAEAAARPVTLSYSHFPPEGDFVTERSNEWAREIEKRSGGRVKFNMYPGGTLTRGPQCYQGVVDGISDIGLSLLAYTVGRFPLMSAMDIPGHGFRTSRQGGLVAWELYKKFRPKEFDNTKLLYLFTSSPGHFQTKKPVRKLEDLSGLQIRCTGLNASAVKALGATPVAMPISECYIALQKGIVDGTLCPYDPLVRFKMNEVTDYTTECYLYESTFWVTMNLDKWNSLPPDIQKIFEEVSEESVERIGALWDPIEANAKQKARTGEKVIALSAEESARWEKLLKPLTTKWIKEKEAMGLPAQEFINKLYEFREKYK
jgi:TRAP-type C4-dicarboxylate transport system substrate-binding protein